MKEYQKEIKKCADILHTGGIILYPGDTVWGLGCLATKEDAIKKIYEIKERPLDKKLILLVSDTDMLQKYITPLSIEILKKIKNFERPTTIIYPKAVNISNLLISSTGSIAIRVVRDEFCKLLIEKCSVPLISTSANLSGEKTPVNFSNISEKIKNRVDYIIRYGREDKIKRSSSRILLLQNNDWITIRD